MKLIEFVNTINIVKEHPPLYLFVKDCCENDAKYQELGHYDKSMTKYDNREIIEIGLIDDSISLVLGPENNKPITRLEWLMQNEIKLVEFLKLLDGNDRDCQDCPFMRDDGMLYGCCYSDPEEPFLITDCEISEVGVEDFLKQEMPTEEQMDKWVKEYEKKYES